MSACGSSRRLAYVSFGAECTLDTSPKVIYWQPYATVQRGSEPSMSTVAIQDQQCLGKLTPQPCLIAPNPFKTFIEFCDAEKANRWVSC